MLVVLTPDTAAAGIESGAFDLLLRSARLFIANPDLLSVFKTTSRWLLTSQKMLAELV